MTTPAAQVPAAAGPHVLHGRDLREDTVLEHTSRFADDRWVLTPAITQRHERSLVLDFTQLPAGHQPVARELFYGLLSGPLPPGLPRVSISTVRKTFTAAAYFLRWADSRARANPSGPAALARLAPADLDDYHRHLLATIRSRGTWAHYRASGRLFWHYRAALSDPLGFDPAALDSWGEPNPSARGENSTPRIPEPVIGPLIAWALRFTDDFAPDILAAASEALALHDVRLGTSGRGLRPGVLEEFLACCEREHRPLPGFGGQVNVTFLARKLGCYPSTLRRSRLLAATAARIGVDTGTYLDTMPTFSLDGRPWLDPIAYSTRGYDSIGTLARMLQTACYILIAYLSGMRDSESNQAPDPRLRHLPARQHRHRLPVEDHRAGVQRRSRSPRRPGHLGRRSPGRTRGGGPRTAPAPRPAAAVRPPALPGGHPARLGEHGPDHCGHPAGPGRLHHLGRHLRRLPWPRRPHPRPPPDRGAADHPAVPPHPGLVHRPPPRRRDRWGPAVPSPRHPDVRRPLGTSGSGFRAEVESEQAIARGEHLLAMIDQHEHDCLTGPGAPEAVTRLAAFAERARFAGQVTTDPRRVQRLMNRHDPAIYPGTYVTCIYNHAKALCARGTGPDLGTCRPLECRNAAFTEANRDALGQELARINASLASIPALPPYLQHTLTARRDALTAFQASHQQETT